MSFRNAGRQEDCNSCEERILSLEKMITEIHRVLCPAKLLSPNQDVEKYFYAIRIGDKEEVKRLRRRLNKGGGK